MGTKAKKSKKPRKKQAAPLPERPRPPVHFRSDAYLKPGTPAYEYDQSVLLDGVAKPDHQPATTAEFILLAVAQTQDYLATLVNELSVDDKAAAGRRLLWWAYRPDAAFARVSMVEALTDKLRAALKLIYPTMAIEVERRLGDLRQLAREYDGMKRWHENAGDWEDSPKLWDPDDLKKAAAELHETLGMIAQAVYESNPTLSNQGKPLEVRRDDHDDVVAISYEGAELDLPAGTVREVFALLIKHLGKTVTYEQFREKKILIEPVADRQKLANHIRTIRGALARGKMPFHVDAITNTGYRLAGP